MTCGKSTADQVILQLHGGTLEIRNRAEGGVRATMTLSAPLPPQVMAAQKEALIEPLPA